MIVVRAATAEDGPCLQDIERRAGERFRHVGLPQVADDAPDTVEALATYAEAGSSWVAVSPTGQPIGYILVDEVDGNAHIEQVSVLPAHQGTGVGRALIDQVRRWAADVRCPAITLTTYAEVPWNRPLYEHLGFRVVPEDEIGAGLCTIRADEKARGLDAAPRVCMRLDLHESSTGG